MGKKRDPSPSSESSASDVAEDVKMEESPEPSKKRKRSSAPAADEIEIDVNLPEPLSKSALRKAKKAKTKPEGEGKKEGADDAAKAEGDEGAAATADGKKKVSDYGIWIGNLPFTADKTVLRVFFTRQGQIPDDDITRVHMPTPHQAQPGRIKPSNKGFAYVDFANKESLDKAIALSESLMTGRKVLIKDAKSFEGRPTNATATSDALKGTEEGAAAAADSKDGKPVKPGMAPSQRVFVGNLGFDITKEDLENHFVQAGEIEDIFMATFQDTGKCKGFAWVRFVELEAAQNAVSGYVFKEEPPSDDEEEEEEEEKKSDSESGSDDDEDEEKPKKTKKAKKAKKPKKRKWFINRLQGRTMRCEFAEDAQTRYKKRFGKGGDREGQSGGDGSAPIAEVGGREPGAFVPKARPRGDKDARLEQRRKKHIDARKIAPGMALANAPRASGAIVPGAGKKTTFD